MAWRFVSGGLFGVALAAVVWWIAASRISAPPTSNAAPGLPIDWSLTKEFPPVSDPDGGPEIPAERVVLRVDGGWLVAQLEAIDGGLQWYVVLARATDPRPPTVETDPMGRTVDVRYGPYFVREHLGRLRVYRERKTADSPAWPMPKLEPGEMLVSTAWNLQLTKAGDWVWLSAGAVAGRPDVRVRFQHAGLRESGLGAQAFRDGLAYSFYGDEGKCFDEGDLLHGRRVPPHEAEAIFRRRKLQEAEFGIKPASALDGNPAPALDGNEWFNAPGPLPLDSLKGKVVLLDFWGKWCGPCVAKIPAVQELHDKYKDRGLVVIGVHSAYQHDRLAEFLKDRMVTYPVVIDSGKTASQYLVKVWPTYFLINKSGKVMPGFSSQLPSAERIEALLNEGS